MEDVTFEPLFEDQEDARSRFEADCLATHEGRTMDIVKRIDQHLMEEEREDQGISLSAIGKCVRSLWYQHKGYERLKLPARSLKVFKFGDMIEEMVIDLMREAGIHIVNTGEDQLEVKLNTPMGDLLGHPDGIVYGESGTPFLLEIKSCSDIAWRWSPGWNKLKEVPEEDPYYSQIQAYLWSEDIQAMGIDACLLVIVCKNTCHMKQFIVDREKDGHDFIMDQAKSIAHENMPVRPYLPVPDKKKNRDVLKYPCTYCGHVRHCYPEHTVYIEKGKPVHVIEEPHE